MSRPLASPRGRPLAIAGDQSLVTLDRLDAIGRRFDEEPRLASVSLRGVRTGSGGWVRASAPAGAVVVIATDVDALTGTIVDGAGADQVARWAQAASDRGLWHDWLLTGDVDVVRGAMFLEQSRLDAMEAASPSSSRFLIADARPTSGAVSVSVDATWLGEHETGAQVLTVAAVEALSLQPSISRIALTGIDKLPGYASRLSDLPNVTVGQSDGRSDVVWFPNQPDARVDLSAARSLGRRIVVTYLDLIAYDIPRYHANAASWEAYRALQRSVALSADGITTISADVGMRLLDEVPRLAAERVRPIPLGLDHVRPEHVPSTRPAELGPAGERPFILVLGNDFAHKNRDLAIATWQELLRRGVSCDLVLAGLHVRGSSSREAEEALLTSHVDLRGRVHRLGHVSSDGRTWLLANAAAVHYPTSAEGFGFVPYEAASLGTPTTFTSFGPLREIARLEGLPCSWSRQEHADDLERLLVDPDWASSRVSGLRVAIDERTWDRFAVELAAFFLEVSSMEPSPGSAVASPTDASVRLAQVLGSRSYRIAARLQRLRNIRRTGR